MGWWPSPRLESDEPSGMDGSDLSSQHSMFTPNNLNVLELPVTAVRFRAADPVTIHRNNKLLSSTIEHFLNEHLLYPKRIFNKACIYVYTPE